MKRLRVHVSVPELDTFGESTTDDVAPVASSCC